MGRRVVRSATLLLALGLMASGVFEGQGHPGSAVFAAEPQEDQATIPAWFLEHVEVMTQGSGRWVADNARYRSEAESMEAYGVEWQKGLGGNSLKGRLFGLEKGKEVATFWEFRVFWHAGLRQVLAYQFGPDGTVGIGPMVSAGPHQERLEQHFFSPSGQDLHVGHESRLDPETGSHETKSFDIQEDGQWKPRRSYVWRRQP